MRSSGEDDVSLGARCVCSGHSDDWRLARGGYGLLPLGEDDSPRRGNSTKCRANKSEYSLYSLRQKTTIAMTVGRAMLHEKVFQSHD